MAIDGCLAISSRGYRYGLAWEHPSTFKEPRIFEEKLSVEGQPIYSRSQAQVTLHGNGSRGEAQFLVDWHLVALPVIQIRTDPDDLSIFKRWLAQTIILAPIPSLMTGASADATLEPETDGNNFGEWFSGLLGSYPAAYSRIDKYLRETMPDFGDIQQVVIGPNAKRMSVSFQKDRATFKTPFSCLSDGEKCFLLGALVLAANQAYGPLLCFWDEPDNYLSLSEVGRFVMELRRAFSVGGQLIATSHNPEAIRKLADENTFVLYRNSHLEPTQVRALSELAVAGGPGRCPHSRRRRPMINKERPHLLVLLIDFDGDEGRMGFAQSHIPRELKERVFILGAGKEPEDIKRATRIGSLEKIGTALAEECHSDTPRHWNIPELVGNTGELERMKTAVKPWLFLS